MFMRSAETLPKEHQLGTPKSPEAHAPLPSFLPDTGGGLMDKLIRSKTVHRLGSFALDTMSGARRLFPRSARHENDNRSHKPHPHTHYDADHYDHDVTVSSKLSERLGRIQLGAAAINAAVMATRGVILGAREGVKAGFDSVNIMSATDAAHNVADWLKWKMEAAVDRHHLSPRTYKIFRGLTCAALAGGGAWSIADATLLHSDYNVYQGAASGVSAGAALYTGNVLLKGLADQSGEENGWIGLWRRRKKISSRNKDKAIHAGTDIFMATGAAVGNLSGSVGNLIHNPGIASGLGSMATALTIAGGAAAIGYFGIHTPFLKGLDKPDDCLLHDHSKEPHWSETTHNHEVALPALSIKAVDLLARHSVEYRKKSWLEQQTRSNGRHRQERTGTWWKRSIAIGALAISAWCAMGGEAQEPPSIADAPEVTQPEAPTNTPALQPAISVQQQVMVKPGDSQWSIASQRITEFTGVAIPQERHIAQITQQMIQNNHDVAPNPHLIHPGDILEIPSGDAIQMIVSH